MTLPELVDYDLPIAGAFHNCVIVSIRKAFPGHAKKVMHAIWGLGMLSLSKSIVVVDAHVDVHDYEEVFFYVGANVDPTRDILLTEGPADHLDHATTLQFLGEDRHRRHRQGPGRGRARVAARDRDDAEIRELVDRRWADYGIAARTRARTARPARTPAAAVTSLTCDPRLEWRRPSVGTAGARQGGRGTTLANAREGQRPGPTIWPIGFAVGIVCILAGLIVSTTAVVAGMIIAVVFGFLWARAATREYRGTAEPPRPRRRPRHSRPRADGAGAGAGAATRAGKLYRATSSSRPARLGSPR